MSSHNQLTEWILETIDHLRKRKARPDLHRICHVVRRRFGLPSEVTERKLEELVDAEIVLKVEYKGSTSYRNASKWRKSMIGCAVQNSNTVSTRIIEAILSLTKRSTETTSETESKLDTGGKQDVPSTSTDTKSISSLSFPKKNDEVGVTLEEIETWLTENCDGFVNLITPLNVVLKREIDAGRVVKLDRCGRFAISKAQKYELDDDAIKLLNSKKSFSKPNSSSPSKVVDNVERKESKKEIQSFPKRESNIGSRPENSSAMVMHQPSRRGRPPKFRPPNEAAPSSLNTKAPKLKRSGSTLEDESSPKKKLSSSKKSPSSAAPDECDLCYKSSQQSGKGEGEALLHCKDCSLKAHPSCLNYKSVLATRAAKGPWQCMDCKTCFVCKDSEEGDLMLFCDGCDKGYHMTCHMPPINKKPSGHWECYSCRVENANLERNQFAAIHMQPNKGFRDSAPPTPAESPIPPSLSENESNSEFPDASKWTVEEVTDYFTSSGFPNEAQVFKEQEIDGVALLLLKREDVLRGLEFKLGPALKVNRLVQGFQAARMS